MYHYNIITKLNTDQYIGYIPVAICVGTEFKITADRKIITKIITTYLWYFTFQYLFVCVTTNPYERGLCDWLIITTKNNELHAGCPKKPSPFQIQMSALIQTTYCIQFRRMQTVSYD